MRLYILQFILPETHPAQHKVLHCVGYKYYNSLKAARQAKKDHEQSPYYIQGVNDVSIARVKAA